MSTVDAFSAINATNSAGGSVAPTATQTASESADRFLKLLVTQMKNQDPLNPMDNAQVTSQMAQISTVSGIEKLNTTVGALNGQFMQMQALQGASLVGHNVTLQGNRLDIVSGTGVGGFGLASAADHVQVEVVNPAGQTVETLHLRAVGRQPRLLVGRGRHCRRRPLQLPRECHFGRQQADPDTADARPRARRQHRRQRPAAADPTHRQRRLQRRQGLQLIPPPSPAQDPIP